MLTLSEAINKYDETAKAKVELSVIKMIILGILAGAFIALAGIGSTFGNAIVNKVVGALIFPIGLIMVVLCGTELFTGNCLLIGPAIYKKIKLSGLVKNWVIVYLANFVGALLVTFLLNLAGVLDAQNISETVRTTASAKVNFGWGQAFIKGIFCNFLVCVAVWLAFISKSTPGKILGIAGPIFLFVLCGFEHSIANMFYIPAEIFSNGSISWVVFLMNNLIPVTLGNIVGGCVFGLSIWFIGKSK